MKWLRSLVLAAMLAVATPAYATTYYLNGATGSDAGNNCTAAQSASTPKATFNGSGSNGAWSCLSAGDTLQVADGTYTTVSPPTGKAGSSGSPIVIQATNEGSVVFSGILSLLRTSYITFIGMTVNGTTTAISIGSGSSAGNPSHHLTFQRVGWYCATDGGDDACFGAGDGTHHMLIEDSWGSGHGRYQMVCYGGSGGGLANTGCDNNTYRRIILRQGPETSGGGQPQASFALYYGTSNIVENVFSINSTHQGDSSKSDFYVTQHSNPPNTSTNKFYGIMSLGGFGVAGQGIFVDVDNGGTAANNEFHHGVMWNVPDWGLLATAVSGASVTGTIFDHMTVYSAGEACWENSASATQLSNSLLTFCGTYGAWQEGGGSIGTHDYNYYFSNTTGPRNGVSTETHTSTTCNPAWLYVVRLETGNCAKGAAADGSDIGGTLLFRYQDGTLTATSLWPYPNETRIKKEMCTDHSVTTGFCASTSLSKYIWEFLGNTCPSGMCSGSTPRRIVPFIRRSLVSPLTLAPKLDPFHHFVPLVY